MKKLLKEWKKFLNVLEEQQGMAPPPEKVDFKNLGRPGSGVSYFKSDANREELEKINADPNVTTYDQRVAFHKAYPYADGLEQRGGGMEQRGGGMEIKPRRSMAWTGGPAKGPTPPGLTEPEETFMSDELEGPVEREQPPETAISRLQSVMRQKTKSPVEKRPSATTPSVPPAGREEIPVEKMLKKKPREQEGGEWEKTQPKATTGRPQTIATSLLSDISSAEKSRMDVVNANRNPAPMSYAHKMLAILQQQYGDEFGDWLGMKDKYDPRGKDYKKGTIGYRDQQNMWRGEKLDPKKVKSLVAVANDRDGDQAESLYALRKLYQAGEYDAIKQLLWKPAARLKEWNEYLKEDKEIKDYADVPGLTATQEEPEVVKFTYDAKPDKYAASREWLKKASKEYFGGVEKELEAGPHSRVKVSYRMKNKDYDKAASLAEMEVFDSYDNFAQMDEVQREVAFNETLLKYLDPRSQQYQDARYIVRHYENMAAEEKADIQDPRLPSPKEVFRYTVPGQVEYRRNRAPLDD